MFSYILLPLLLFPALSEEELESEVATLDKTRERLKKEEEIEMLRLETLCKGMTEANKYWMCKRYLVMRSLIQNAIVDCLE